jgi:hypothetical protein
MNTKSRMIALLLAQMAGLGAALPSRHDTLMSGLEAEYDRAKRDAENLAARKHETDTRQQRRRRIFQRHFERMEPTQPHGIVVIRNGRKVKGERSITPLRAERRKMARAFAAGEWRKNNGAVA